MAKNSGITGAFPGGGWLLVLLCSAMSAVAQIQPAPAFTAAQLKGKWRTHLEGSGLGAQHSGQGQPIEERPVPQEPRQKTAATQPCVIGDSVVPQEIDIARYVADDLFPAHAQ